MAMVIPGFLSAVMLVLSFPSYSVWGLIFVALVPYLVAMYQARSYSEVFWIGVTSMVGMILMGYGWISFVATNFGGLPWIVGKLVLFVYALVGETQLLLFALLAFGVYRKLLGIRSRFVREAVNFVLLPLVYIGIDFLWPKIFPQTLGHVLYGWLPVAQLAEYCGEFGLTLPILMANIAVATLVHRLLIRKKWLAPRGVIDDARGSALMALLTLVAVACGLWRAEVWGKKRMHELQALEDSYTRQFKISLIQANIGDVDKLASERGFQPAINLVLKTYRDMSLETVRKFHPDMVVWPETAYPYLYTHMQDSAANRSGAARDDWIREMVGELKTPLLFGTYSNFAKRDYNSAFLVKPPYLMAGLYRKSILLAFGEYVPLGPLGPVIQNIIPTIADFGRGKGPEILELNGVKFAPQICYEGIFQEHSRGGVRLGADFLLNITNDSWFGDGTEPWLHLWLTVFRSIELRRPLVRSTNTGVSTLVDVTGEMRYTTRLFEPGFLEATLKLPGRGQSALETFYYWHGEIFAQLAACLAVIVALIAFGAHLKGAFHASFAPLRRLRSGRASRRHS